MEGPKLINFCIQPFARPAETSSICADGHSTSNLTSSNAQLRGKGFRVEHFIRPPVQLEFSFTVPIATACIIVHPDLTADAEARVEVSASSGGSDFRFCGNGTVQGPNCALAFRNKAFERSRGKVEMSPKASVLGSYLIPRLTELQLVEQTMKYSNATHTLRTLRLSITRFTGPRPVALRSVEVWGMLSPACGDVDRQTAERNIHALLINQPMASPFNCVGVYNTHQLHVDGPLEMHLGNHTTSHSLMDSQYECSARDCSDCPHPTTVHSPRVTGSQEQGGCMVCPDTWGAGAYPSRNSNCFDQPKEECHNECRDPLRMEERVDLAEGKEQSSTQQVSTGELTKSPCVRNPVKVSSIEKPTYRTLPGGKSEALLCAFSSDVSPGLQHKTVLKVQAPNYPSGLPLLSSRKEEQSTSGRQAVAVERPSTCHGAHPPKHSEPVPDTFLDQITYEVMLIPMLLPSGHYVDQETLEKLMHTDTVYGRRPCDPFTGVPFTETSQPQFCAELKAQIDRFLSDREELLTGRGRSVGSASDIARHLIHKGQSMKRARMSGQSPGSGLEDVRDKRPRHNSTLRGSCGSSQIRTQSQIETLDRKSWVHRSECTRLGELRTSIEGNSSTTSMGDQTASERKWDHGHEVEVADSLNKALHDLFPTAQ